MRQREWGLRAVLFACSVSLGCGADGAAPATNDAGTPSRADDAATRDAGSSSEAGARTDAGGAEPRDAAPMPGVPVTYGSPYAGGEFHLGPVDWTESQWHNACAAETKYLEVVRRAEGQLLAGLWNGIADPAQYCDACISVQTARGKSAVLRVVTYGDTTRNSIDVSPEAYALLDSGEYPRNMTWQLAKCPDTGKMMYEFKSGAHQWWTAFWVRNARVPIQSVEVKGVNDSGYAACSRESDGSLVDGNGFGQGAFSIRVTASDGQTRVDSFGWPAAGIGGALLEGSGNFE